MAKVPATGKWRVQRCRRPDGSLYKHAVNWDTFDGNGEWTGIHATWAEAMEWATSFAAHVEYWLECQTRRPLR
ncbi:Gp35 [Mycolicibacterium canariasense]|uniref:Gp35 n=1 Tax=Mycolicibacterium canariasense TaxID=228230 RepID=A0A124E223_MYCCR|nr:Gp35 [Mycolicibacterium canariasense]